MIVLVSLTSLSLSLFFFFFLFLFPAMLDNILSLLLVDKLLGS